MRSILSFFTFLVYPLWFPVHILRDKKHRKLVKVLSVLFSLGILLPIWIGSYYFIAVAATMGLQSVGIVRVAIPVVGDSMLPTILDKTNLPVHRYPHLQDLERIKQLKPYAERLKPDLQRGDIVVFKNTQTVEVFDAQHKDPRKQGGFVKRIIGLPGDVVSIRNGYVSVNGETIDEPYILKARSTFGGTAVADCSAVTVPENKYFVLGDNRKVSLDSRAIGLIDKKDVEFYLPLNEQRKLFGKRWRDTTNDQDIGFASEFVAEDYVEFLNQKRAEKGIEPLKLEPKLSESAEKRAKVMLEYNDLSFEATRSGYTIQDSFRDVGYSNVVYGEFPVLGYYDASELIDSFFEYPDSAEFLLEKDYQEIGVSTFVGFLNGCPVQIVVQHLAGYKPPNYERTDILEWQALVDKLQEIRPGWQDLKFNEPIYKKYQKDIDRINEIIRTRSARAKQIVQRMEKNEWFTDEEKRFIEEDKALFDEQNEIADRLNRALQGDE